MAFPECNEQSVTPLESPSNKEANFSLVVPLREIAQHYFPQGSYPPADQMIEVMRLIHGILGQTQHQFLASDDITLRFLGEPKKFPNFSRPLPDFEVDPASPEAAQLIRFFAGPELILYTDYLHGNEEEEICHLIYTGEEFSYPDAASSIFSALEKLSGNDEESLNSSDQQVNPNKYSVRLEPDDLTLTYTDSGKTLKLEVTADDNEKPIISYIIKARQSGYDGDDYREGNFSAEYKNRQALWDVSNEDQTLVITGETYEALSNPLYYGFWGVEQNQTSPGRPNEYYSVDYPAESIDNNKRPAYYLNIISRISKLINKAVISNIGERIKQAIDPATISQLQEQLTNLFNDLDPTITNPGDYMLYKLIWDGTVIWTELDQITATLISATSYDPKRFSHNFRLFGLAEYLPFVRKMSPSERETFFTKLDNFDFQADPTYWSTAFCLLPELTSDYDHRTGRENQQGDRYFLRLFNSLAKYPMGKETEFGRLLKLKISQLLTPNPSLKSNSRRVGYDPETARAYTARMDKILKEKGSIEQDIILDWLGPDIEGKKVLDAACGSGNEVNLLTQKGAEVYGIDASQEQIRQAQEKFPGIKDHFLLGNIDNLPFTEFFDIVVCKYALNENEDIATILKAFHRCLKPGGTLLLFIHHPMSQMASSIKPTNYFGNERVDVDLGGVIISDFQHQLREYLSKKAFTQHFILEDFDEGQDPALRVHPDKNYPEWLIIKATKR